MNSKLFPCLGRWCPKYLSALILGLGLAAGAHAQATYTWTGGSGGKNWASATNWTPSGGPPGATSTVVNLGNSASPYLSSASSSVGTIDSGTGVFTIYEDKTASFTVGTINQGSSYGSANTFLESDTTNNSTYQLTLAVSNVNITSGTLSLGNAAAGDELYGLMVSGGVTLNGTTTQAVLNLNNLANYSLGLVNATGTSDVIDLIANSDATLGAYSRTATVTGLTGAGELVINGAGGSSTTVGGTATLEIQNSGSTNYLSEAVLADGTAQGPMGLALVVDLTGSGAQTLAGTSTYSGGTTIGAGALYVVTLGPPVITTEPATQTVLADGAVVFTVAATGAGNSYQWSLGSTPLSNGTQSDGSVVSGATTASLSLSNIQTTDAGNYTVTVTNAGGTATSTPAAVLTVDSSFTTIPTILVQPSPETVNIGGTAVFTVVATGADDSYQWSQGSTPLTDGSGISGSATATLTLTNVQSASAGSYTVVVGNSGTDVTSLSPTLTVSAPASGLGSGAVTVQSNATLGGTGPIAPSAGNSVTVNGALTPGDLGVAGSGTFSPATLTFNMMGGSQLIFGGGSALNLSLGGTPSSVSFTTAGNWLNGTGNWTLNLTNGGGVQVGTAYPVFANDTDSPTSFAPAAVTYTTGSTLYTLTSTAYELQTIGSNYSITLPGPVITAPPPASTNLVVGGSASFTVAASGTGPLTYQWELNGTALTNGAQGDESGVSGATTTTLNLTNLQLTDAGQYTCAITDAVGTVSSPAAALVSGPTIGTQPAPTSANAGGNASFSVVATGVGTLSYQWSFNGTALTNGTETDGTVVSGATSATLDLTGVHGADAGSYTVVVTDTGGPTTSSAATLTVNEPPAFTVQPVSVGLAAGQTASFYAPATGAGTVTYQWYLSSTAITNATDAYLLVTPVSSANAGSYTCIATNAAGSTTSTAATLTLSASTDLGRLTNVSVRTNCGTGSANIIAGFVLGGAGNTGSSKSMLIRADGPELANFGVPGFLPDPSLEVFNTTDSPAESVGQNTGWCVPTSNEAPVVAAENAVYAFALTTNSASSAIVLDLPPDQYTENVTGASGDTGIALAEIYDVTNATETYSAALPRLINVSARANVAASGAGNLIAGFTIGGSTDKTVLVRGTGPGLAEFSLTGLLAQPTLAVYSTASGDTLVASNTGWDEDPVLAAAAASVYAFTQTSSADCALLVTLPPGTYTANLNSNDGTSGLALVEVYEVP